MRHLLCTLIVLLAGLGTQAQSAAHLDHGATLPTSAPQDHNIDDAKWAKLSEQEKQNLLFAAVDGGDVEETERLLSKTYQSHYFVDEDGETLLTLAIANRDQAMVELLTEDAVINLKNKKGETPLTLAIKQGDRAIIDLVLQRAKAGLKNDHDETPLYLVIEKTDDLELVQDLLERGANPNLRTRGVSPLALAVSEEKVKIVANLVRHGADPSLANENGELPLTIAVNLGNPVLAGILLHKSHRPETDVNWANASGENLLSLAVMQNNEPLARVLIDAGGNVHSVNYLENTPLNLAAEKGYAKMAELLVSIGADVNHANIMGTTPITAAATNGHTTLANWLAEQGADPNARNYEGIAANDYGSFRMNLTEPAIQQEINELMDDN